VVVAGLRLRGSVQGNGKAVYRRKPISPEEGRSAVI